MQTERLYEILILTVPEITQDEAKSIEKHIDDVVQRDNGSVVSFDRWGKYKLCYPVKKQGYGVYYLARFKTPKASSTPEQVTNLMAIRFDSLVMRSVVTALSIDSSSEYQRPRSLEEIPAEEAGGSRDFRRGDRFGGRRSGGMDRRGRFEGPARPVEVEDENSVDAEDVDTEVAE